MKVSEAVRASVVADKKKADFKWREWADLAKKTQDLYRRASVTQKHATIKLGDGKRPICILPFSDQHIGSRGMSYGIFRKMTEEILATDDLYIGIMGDLAEFAVKLRSVGEICAQLFSPEKQMQFVEDWFNEVKHKVAFVTWGNHEDERGEKQLGFAPMKWLMGKEAVYFDGIGHADIVVGKQSYKWALTHKFQGYSYHNPCHAGMRYMRFQGVDREIGWMGDKHTAAFIKYFDGPMLRCSGIAGTLHIDSLYASRYFSIFTQPVFPCMVMYPDQHIFTPYYTLAEWKLAMGR